MESGNLIWLMRVYPVLTIVSRAGMIQELVMIGGGLLCMSTDDLTHNDVPALIEHFCVEWFYTFMCFSSSLSSFFLGTSRLAYDLCVMLNGPNSFAARAFPRTALASLGELTTFSQYLLTADISIKNSDVSLMTSVNIACVNSCVNLYAKSFSVNYLCSAASFCLCGNTQPNLSIHLWVVVYANLQYGHCDSWAVGLQLL